MQIVGSSTPVSTESIETPDMTDFNVRIERSFLALEGLRQKWDEAVIALGGSIYMSYDWSRTWWEFYGTGKELRIFLFSAADRIVGIVPIYIDRIGFGPARCSIARLVGANIPPKVFDPPIHKDFAAKILAEILVQLFEKDGCDVFSLGPMSEQHGPTHGLESAARASNGLVGSFHVTRGVHTIFWLPSSMEEYFEALSKNERKNRRKYELRTLRKEYEAKVEVVSDPAKVDQEFEDFVGQHTLHWNAQGMPGHFRAWPKATEYNRALVKAQGNLGRMRFVRILANNQVIANQYAFAFGNSYVWELPARAVGEQWERFSLGPTGIVTMIDAAIKEGKSRLEGGLAHYDYKLRLNAKEHATLAFRMARNRSVSRVRLALMNLCRLCLLVGYHKIWYQRIRPRIPALRGRPQWGLWLRLDF
jgi:hypothetical protein